MGADALPDQGAREVLVTLANRYGDQAVGDAVCSIWPEFKGLRDENERLLAKWRETDALWVAAKAEVERLRGQIKKAPHAHHCEARSPMWPGPCTCWKASDLAPASDETERSA